MVITIEQKAFMINSYFRNDKRVNCQWGYLTRDTIQDFQTEFPDIVMDFDLFRQISVRSVALFKETGNTNRKEGNRRPKVRPAQKVKKSRQIVNEQPHPIQRLNQQVISRDILLFN